MKRILYLIAVFSIFILSTSLVLAKNDNSKGKGPTTDLGGQRSERIEKQAQPAKEKVRENARAVRERTEEASATEEKAKEAKEKVRENARASRERTEEASAAEEKAKEAKEKAKEQAEKAGKDVEEKTSKGKQKAEEAKGKGKGKAQKAEALAKQLEHEQKKHETRQSRLAEMLKVAQEKGDEKAVGRIEKLIDKEQTRYNKKHAKMTERAADKSGGDEAEDEPAEEDE